MLIIISFFILPSLPLFQIPATPFRNRPVEVPALRKILHGLLAGSLITNVLLVTWVASSGMEAVFLGRCIGLAFFFFLVYALIFVRWKRGGSRQDQKPMRFTTKNFPCKNSGYWLSDLEALTIREKVDRHWRQERPFLKKSYRVDDLAEAIGVSRHKLAACFTQTYRSNFNELVNRRRIEHGLEKVAPEKWEAYTLEGMAFHLGFGSRSTFTKSFKKITGMTPSKYRRRHLSVARQDFVRNQPAPTAVEPDKPARPCQPVGG